ncbi:MAG: hypothetical protein HKN76_15765 [Saprospiraceae bacterium]|nr:hypothetical protein [Saprospiraceae bacterium]
MSWLFKKRSKVYYIAGDGNDRNLGTHPTMAWASIERVNKHRKKLRDGDLLLFKRGFLYLGKLLPGHAQRGPKVAVGAYGSGDYPEFEG